MPAHLILVSDNSLAGDVGKAGASAEEGAIAWAPPPRVRRAWAQLRRRVVDRLRDGSQPLSHAVGRDDRGAVTAEYAIVIMAAVLILMGISC